MTEIHGEENTRILDCRYSLSDPVFGGASYRQGHIPGAIHVDWREFFTDKGFLKDRKLLKNLLKNLFFLALL